jgi:probable HAF family extracellular repeat protein
MNALHHRVRRLPWAIVALLFLVRPGATATAALRYRVESIGTLPDACWTCPYGLNNRGHVVGTLPAYLPTYHLNAFFYDGTGFREVGSAGPGYSRAQAINDQDQIAGYTCFPSGIHAFLYDSTGLHDLGTFGGNWSQSAATGINNAGQVVGWSQTITGSNHAFLYSDGLIHDIHPSGSRYSRASAINELGQIVGEWSPPDAPTQTHAFLYDGIGMHDLGTLSGSSYITPWAVNNRGQVVGEAGVGPGNSHAFFHDGTAIHDLGTLGGPRSAAHDINDAGQAVGFAESATTNRRAFVWGNGTMHDLNDLIPANSPWVLLEAFSINEAGQIACVGTRADDGCNRVVLLTPLTAPPPSTSANLFPLPNAAG